MGLLNETQSSYYSGTNFGSYQFTSLSNIINQFEIAYVGEGKIIPKINKLDIAFHAQRALQELSFDTFKSTKSQEIELPPSLTMPLPQDYVNYVKLTYSDSSGIEHVLYPAIKTSNPLDITQAADGSYTTNGTNLTTDNASTTNESFSTLNGSNTNDDYMDDTYWPMSGNRYGLNPVHAQSNGSFFIDELTGKIHFSSNISGKTVILKYISDSLGTDAEMQVHKFAEEAMYKCIAYAILSTTVYGQQLVPRFKKEKFAEVRKAKLRLSSLKLEELTQILRGKSKQIKH